MDTLSKSQITDSTLVSIHVIYFLVKKILVNKILILFFFLKLQLSRTETIKFLESVKAHLTDLRSRYQEFLIVSEDAEDSGGGESPSVGVTGGDDNNGESGDSVTSSTTNIPT